MDIQLLDLAGFVVADAARHMAGPSAADARPTPILAANCCLAIGVPGFGGVVEATVRGFWRHLGRSSADESTLNGDGHGAGRDLAGGIDRDALARDLDVLLRKLRERRLIEDEGAAHHGPEKNCLEAFDFETQDGRAAAADVLAARAIGVASPAGLQCLTADDHSGSGEDRSERLLAALYVAALAVHKEILAIRGPVLRAVTLGLVTHCGVAEARASGPGAVRSGSQPNATSLNDAIAEYCRNTGLAEPLLAAVVEIDRRDGLSDLAILADLDLSVTAALEAAGAIANLLDHVGDRDDLEEMILACLDALRDGRIDDTHQLLAAIRATLAASPAASTGNPLARLALRVLVANAHVSALTKSWREAARSFRDAADGWPIEARLERWRLRLQQGRCIARAARRSDKTIALLCEAAQIFAAAGGCVSERDCPLEWAEGNVELANLLLELGDLECRGERYLAAALHFKPALDVFTAERHLDGWSRAQLGLAMALRGQGSFQGDSVTLRDAAFAFRAALGVLTRDLAGEAWNAGRCALADVLVRIAEETGDEDAMAQAMDLLMQHEAQGDGQPASRMDRVADIAMARAMIFLADPRNGAAGDDDSTILDEALALLDRATEGDETGLTRLELAEAERARGTIAARLASQFGRGSELLTVARAALARARDLYQATENDVEADAIDRQIDALDPQADTSRADDTAPDVAGVAA